MAMTFTYDDGQDAVNGGRGRIRTVRAAWTSDADGDASGTTRKINGELLKGVTIPADGPTDNYDITLTDADSADLLAGCDFTLANRDTTNTETAHFIVTNAAATDPGGIGARPAVNSAITVTVANAGNTKSGTLVLYYRV